MLHMGYPSVEWFDGWSLAGGFTTIDLLATTTSALNGALLARRPSHYRSYTIVGVLLIAMIGGITGSVTRDLLVNEIPAALTNPAYIVLSLAAGIIGYLVAFKPGELFREGLLQFVTSASLPWFAIVGAQKGVQVGLPTIAVLLLAVASATAARYVIDVSSGVTPKLFVRGEWYAGTALLAAIIWVVCDTFDLNRWVCAGIAFAISYTVRVLAMLRGWEEPMPRQQAGVRPLDDGRPLLGPRLKGRSQRELRDLGLVSEDGRDDDQA